MNYFVFVLTTPLFCARCRSLIVGLLCVRPTNNSLILCSLQELTAVLRSMGQNPTDSEVHDMINEVSTEVFIRHVPDMNF